MSYRRKYKRGKKMLTSRFWTAEFRFKGRLYRQGGFTSRAMADQWESESRTRLLRNEYGLRKNEVGAEVKPLIEAYAEQLRAMRRKEMYVYTTEKRLRRVAEGCGWQSLGDVTAASFEKWRGKPQRQENRKRVASAKTLNQFLDAARQWCDWLVRPQFKLVANPLTDVAKLPAPDRRFYRRGATGDELDKLFAVAGPRRSYYQFAAYIPLRQRAMHGLLWGDMDLGDVPTLHLRANLNKTNRDISLPIRADLAVVLRKERGKSDERVFPNPPTLDELRADWQAAGVEFDRGGEHRLDFHAFRRTAVGMLKSIGVGLDVAHHLLGHKDIKTTQRFYDADPSLADLRAAVERMRAPTMLRIAGA